MQVFMPTLHNLLLKRREGNSIFHAKPNSPLGYIFSLFSPSLLFFVLGLVYFWFRLMFFSQTQMSLENLDFPLFSTVQKSKILSPDLVITGSISDMETIIIRAVNLAVDSIMFSIIESLE